MLVDAEKAIVDKLRKHPYFFWLNGSRWMMGTEPEPLCLEAADLIESLSAQMAELKDRLGSAEMLLDGAKAQVAELKGHLKEIEFSASGYCPACSGWEVTKGRGCQPKVHTKTCWLDAAKEGKC